MRAIRALATLVVVLMAAAPALALPLEAFLPFDGSKEKLTAKQVKSVAGECGSSALAALPGCPPPGSAVESPWLDQAAGARKCGVPRGGGGVGRRRAAQLTHTSRSVGPHWHCLPQPVPSRPSSPTLQACGTPRPACASTALCLTRCSRSRLPPHSRLTLISSVSAPQRARGAACLCCLASLAAQCTIMLLAPLLSFSPPPATRVPPRCTACPTRQLNRQRCSLASPCPQPPSRQPPPRWEAPAA